MSRRTTWAATGWLLLSSLRLRRRELARLVGWSLLEAGPTLLSGLLLARAVDDGFLAGRTGLGLAWLGALAVTAVLGAWATRQASLQLASVVEPFRDELVHMTVRGALHRSTAVGENPDTAGVARMTHQVEVVREAYASMIMVVQAVLVSTVSALIGLLALVPMALVLVLPPLLLGVVIFLVALRATAARQRDAILAEEDIARATSAMTDGLRDVVACGAERRVAAAVGRHVETQARAVRDVARMTAVRSVSVGVGGWGPLVVVLLASPWLVDNGATAGAVLGVITYVMQGLLPALQTLVDGMGESGLWLAVTLHRIVEAATPAGVVPPGRSGLARNRRAGRVRARLLRRVYHPAGAVDLELRGVTFGYGRRAEPVVDHLDLRIPAGDHLAVVGPSGVGKSTLAGLLTGVLRPQEGQVLLGGVLLEKVSARDLHAHRVLIPQQAYVFAGSLLENLVYLRGPLGVPSTDELDEAVEVVGMTELARRLGGYHAEVDPGRLSAGERQLITLVRAYLSPAGIVVLDEATCHLDPAAEARAELAFAHRPGTLVVIAHRISSALRARRVLVMDGQRISLGTHEELLRESPLYRDLVGRWGTDGARTTGNGHRGNGSQPAGVLGYPDRLDPVARPGLGDRR